jgi:hypothetical protein
MHICWFEHTRERYHLDAKMQMRVILKQILDKYGVYQNKFSRFSIAYVAGQRTFDFRNSREYLNQLSDYQMLKKNLNHEATQQLRETNVSQSNLP